MEIQQATAAGWIPTKKGLKKTFVFSDFKEALVFINKVGAFSEKVQHHPEIQNTYNRVHLIMWTHDEDALTEKDINWIIAFETEKDN